MKLQRYDEDLKKLLPTLDIGSHINALNRQSTDLKHDLGTHTGFQESGTGPGQPDLSDETAAVRDRPGFVVREAVRDRPGGRGRRRQNFVLILSYIP